MFLGLISIAGWLGKPIVMAAARLGRGLKAAGLLVALGLPGALAADEYHLAPGDVLRVMIVGEPELTVDVPIEMDGTAWFPLVGAIAAGGETLGDVRSQTANAFVTMSLSRPVVSGTGLPQIIDTNQVLISVASYRSVYVTGDVVGAGEVPYRPGMTLHHLLAVAGNLASRGRSVAATPGEIEAAATALAHEYAQIWRQKAFLNTDTPADFDRIYVTRSSGIEELVAVERSILTETRADLEARKQSLRGEIARIEGRIAVLIKQKEAETEGFTIDEADLATVQELFSRNLVPASRLTEVRRANLVTASRVFQIEVALESARGQVASLDADILSVDSDARVSAWNALADAISRVQQRRADLETLVSGTGGNQMADLLPQAAKITVTRDGMSLAADETSPSLALMPGDIVEIQHLQVGSSAPDADGEANQ
jgi:polysaccharide biosynthesis/export protein